MERRFTDDLPTVRLPRLRASGVITPETTEFVVRLGDVEQTVGITLQRFANQGSWSLFIAPCCGRKARALRLLCGQVLCTRCCADRGVRRRADPMSVRQRAEHRIPKLRAKLESAESLRLKPHLWGTMERRKRFEAKLAMAEFIASRGQRYRDVLKQTPEIEPEPIAKPKIKTTRPR